MTNLPWHLMSSSNGLIVSGDRCLLYVCELCRDIIGCCFVWRYYRVFRLVMTRRHNSVRVDGVIRTMSPLVVVEGPLVVVEGLMLRTACRPPPS